MPDLYCFYQDPGAGLFKVRRTADGQDWQVTSQQDPKGSDGHFFTRHVHLIETDQMPEYASAMFALNKTLRRFGRPPAEMSSVEFVKS